MKPRPFSHTCSIVHIELPFSSLDGLSHRGWSLPQKQSPRTVRSRINGPPDQNHSHTWSSPAADGPTLGMASVEAEKWTRKDEAIYAVSLRLGFEAS